MSGLLDKFHLAVVVKPVTFKRTIIKFIPVLLPISSVILCVSVFILDELIKIPNELVFWLPLGIINLLISMISGILIKRLHYGAHNDPLTGLYNRRYLNSRLNEELSRVQRTHSPLSLILIDIDNFKKVNDLHGHLMGDEVLKKFGKILKQNTRNIDIIARWGGEEFAMILPETDLNGAEIFAERLRKNIENHDFGFQVTISLGVVSTCDELSLDELLSQADEALYTAKEKKNKVVTYYRKTEQPINFTT